MKAAVILGAGFSKNSGIPVQNEIPGMLISDKLEDEFSAEATGVIKNFISDVFSYDGTDNVPALDDIFASIDIAISSGHHLGIEYGADRLKAVKALILYRLFCVLERCFRATSTIKSFLATLSESFSGIGYIVLNWDTVLERYCMSVFKNCVIDYCNGGIYLNRTYGSNGVPINIAKIHGSSNWLFCDNCRTVFNDIYNEISVVQRSGIQQSNFKLFGMTNKFNNKLKTVKCLKCSVCGNVISSHVMTFGYRKSFKAYTFPLVWKSAENILSSAERWIFIGYSMPCEDYEFKHLLKIAELKMKHKMSHLLKVDVVLLNDSDSMERYRRFFGRGLNICCNQGIERYIELIKDTKG